MTPGLECWFGTMHGGLVLPKEFAAPNLINRGLLHSFLLSFLPSLRSLTVFPITRGSLCFLHSWPHYFSFLPPPCIVHICGRLPPAFFLRTLGALIGTNQFSKSLIATKTSEDRIAFPNSSGGFFLFFFSDWRSWGALNSHRGWNLWLSLNFHTNTHAKIDTLMQTCVRGKGLNLSLFLLSVPSNYTSS